MLDISNESTTVPQTSLNNPIITDSSKISPTTSESYSVQITTIRLNGDNFLRWSQSVWMYIKGRVKMGYLMGEKNAPAVDDPNYAIWDAENSMLWENVNQMYSDLGNQSQIFKLTLKLGEIRQGADNWKSAEDGRHHKKTMKDNRIFKFLAGLNVEFDEVRRRIIGRQPLPSIGKVFSEVRREESRRNVMLGKKGPGVAIEGSALVTTGGGYNKAATFQRKSNERPWVWCDFCNKPRHTRENCWKIHGKPANWKGKTGDKPSRAIIPTTNEVETSPFTTEQMEHLLALLKSNSTSGTPNVSLSHTGNELYALSCRFKSTPWIIDFGASDHMTNSSNMFESYSPCPRNKKVRIAYGNFSPITGKGLIQISEGIDLKSVLHVPKLTYNFLYVSKLSRDSIVVLSSMFHLLYFAKML
ncbi:hypothetical protein PVL29_014710 [Vitis rotundifolia]|uniref:Retrotransposon Copia-like N-terminal domain-containing protein n=1 Tax=Vitis rotundifolia TaxID=103349 RepID=A0AA39DMB9_VITRO|nr:hypothetical protein PVL29_014710 [Vitis rotundifolia]